MKRSWAEAVRGAAALAALALAACQTAPAVQSPATVNLTTEKIGRFTVLVGPTMRHGPPFLGVPSTNFYLLRSFIDTRNGETVHQLYIEDSYPGAERVWNAAQLATGEPLRFIPISKNEITCELSCSYAEEFAAALPEGLLRANPQGFTVVFSARSGAQKRIAVAGDLVTKQLLTADQTRTALSTAAPPAAIPPR